ncbi:MAG: class II D-tagatose-bisphosphate aldolase, non-catalytic subunit [Acidibrevibacterium sp.]|uniref:class II D-tagatose-bisphosphate aldolase non-catalytic subunit n=1 Tax=Acidibrevibacterium fodinaquatile TaxID=1969806 RepID=UPI0023A7D84C|nr:class II D-tagatose-bisphosphate aldolase, non-catalytic subunit [Acidibrevibacterium fodinaquatile]MCA7120762.1 class II D-tagatose-bisphosphate aldolase, non-catalytic subunit [Acidibrevibacterium fodinaquatile]
MSFTPHPGFFRTLVARRGQGGVASLCSAHPMVIEAALARAARAGNSVLIEATCNQVNHRGGYTGATPAMFRDSVLAVAEKQGVAPAQIIFGGDHLGPLPWRDAPVATALREAEACVRAFATAGFAKIHLDASMACADDPPCLPEIVIAERAARLAAAAEDAARDAGYAPPHYVIGTEVPPAGGGHGDAGAITPTTPEAAVATLALHHEIFARCGLHDAITRIIAIVVQPGIEYDNFGVMLYQPAQARALSNALSRMPGLVYEAHSTDYQPVSALRALVADGFAILKVGPALTFALREALYALDSVARILDGDGAESLVTIMEKVMQETPKFWQSHCIGDDRSQKIQRHYGFSDRIRYYWSSDAAEAAVTALLARFAMSDLPKPLMHHFFPALRSRVLAGERFSGRALVLAAIDQVLDEYEAALG